MTRPRLYMRAALPSEYLRRWAVLHDIFELPTFFEGHIPNGTPEPDMAISQPYIDQAEDDPPVADDVTLFMEAYKFVRINDEWLANPENRGVTWYRPKDGILITDAHPRNFRKHLETHVLVPIDLVVTVVPPKSSRLLACPVKVWESDSQLAKD